MFFIQTLRKRREAKRIFNERRDWIAHVTDSTNEVYYKLREMEDSGILPSSILKNFEVSEVDENWSYKISFSVDDHLKAVITCSSFLMDEYKFNDIVRFMTFYVDDKEVIPDSLEEFDKIVSKICLILNQKFAAEWDNRKSTLKKWIDSEIKPPKKEKKLILEGK